MIQLTLKFDNLCQYTDNVDSLVFDDDIENLNSLPNLRLTYHNYMNNTTLPLNL